MLWLCSDIGLFKIARATCKNRLTSVKLSYNQTEKQLLDLLLCSSVFTVRSKSFRTFFLNLRHMRKTHTFFIQNKLHWHIYRLLCPRIISEKLPKIPLFGTSLIHQLRLLGSQQHPQSGVLLTSFSTWGTENSLLEINLKSRRCDKGF